VPVVSAPPRAPRTRVQRALGRGRQGGWRSTTARGASGTVRPKGRRIAIGVASLATAAIAVAGFLSRDAIGTWWRSSRHDAFLAKNVSRLLKSGARVAYDSIPGVIGIAYESGDLLRKDVLFPQGFDRRFYSWKEVTSSGNFLLMGPYPLAEGDP